MATTVHAVLTLSGGLLGAYTSGVDAAEQSKRFPRSFVRCMLLNTGLHPCEPHEFEKLPRHYGDGGPLFQCVHCGAYQ